MCIRDRRKLILCIKHTIQLCLCAVACIALQDSRENCRQLMGVMANHIQVIAVSYTHLYISGKGGSKLRQRFPVGLTHIKDLDRAKHGNLDFFFLCDDLSPHYYRWNRKSFSYTTSND